MNLLKSLAAVSSMTMFSRVLGFARDAIVARIFGAGMATDAFFVAFKLPNLLRRIFAEGAFSQAFVPILAEYKSKQGEDATRVFVSYVSGLLTLALAIVTVIGMLAAPWVITITAPGFADTADKFALTTQLLRITFPYILLISWLRWWGDPQYLEPLLGAGLCADVPQRQYDWFCAVCRAVFPSAGAGAGLGGDGRRRAAAGLPAAASEEDWHAGPAAN